MPSRSLAPPVVTVIALAAVTGFVGRTGTYLPFVIESRGSLLSLALLGVNLFEALVATGGAVAAGYLLLDGRWVTDRLGVTVLAVGAAALVGHALGVTGAIAVQPERVSLPDNPIVVVGGLLIGSLTGSLALPVGVVAGAAVRRLQTRTG